MRAYTKQEVTWWLADGDFDSTAWWMVDGTNQVDFDHPCLSGGKRSNGSKFYRPGPIYWEILRRHPELPQLREAARGKNESNLRGENLVRRLSILDLRCRGPVFYLISLYGKTWLDLPGDAPQRFEKYLPGFASGASGNRPSQLRFPNPLVDLIHESADELGLLTCLSSFIRDVETRTLEGEGSPVPSSNGEPLKTERVILWDRLVNELSRFGMEPALLSFLSIANNKSIAEAFLGKLKNSRRKYNKPGKKGRLQPDVLRYLASIASSRSCCNTGRRNLNRYFMEFSFSRMIQALGEQDNRSHVLPTERDV